MCGCLPVGTCPYPHGAGTGRTWHIVPHPASAAGAGIPAGTDRGTGRLLPEIIPDLEAAKWLAEAGIPYPDTFEWSVSFRFTSNGETVLLSGNETERKAWFTLSVELFGPQALYGDYTRFTSYHIHVRNGDNSVHGHWNERTAISCVITNT